MIPENGEHFVFNCWKLTPGFCSYPGISWTTCLPRKQLRRGGKINRGDPQSAEEGEASNGSGRLWTFPSCSVQLDTTLLVSIPFFVYFLSIRCSSINNDSTFQGVLYCVQVGDHKL